MGKNLGPPLKQKKKKFYPKPLFFFSKKPKNWEKKKSRLKIKKEKKTPLDKEPLFVKRKIKNPPRNFPLPKTGPPK